jgi:AraC-like DNA-binding protein
MSVLNLGPVQASTLTYSPLEVFRTSKQIRQSDPGMFQLALHLGGRLGVAQSDREVELGTGDLTLYDTSRPYYGWADAEDGALAGCMVVLIPRKLIPLRPQVLEPIQAVPVSGRRGVGALLARHLIELHRNAASYTAGDAARLGNVTADLVAATYAHELEATSALPPETHQQALRLRIHDFIQRNLGDPTLAPGTIAAAHAISVRYLYKLFQEQSLTVAGWIRQQRLERCRHELGDPQQRHRAVHSIANGWGFTSDAHFSRLFRATYGVTPTDYRRQRSVP